MAMEFGRSIRPLWSLLEDGTFLNHGSYGACPLAVLQAQDRIRRTMETQPDIFFHRQIMPTAENSALRLAAKELAAFVGVAQDTVAFVENATTGVQAVLQSMSFAPTDQILITDHQYNAVRLAVESRCKETGAIPCIVRIPIPTSPAEVLSRILEAAGPRVKLAIVDHITSATALVLPIGPIVAELRERGIAVLVDGAHVLGQLPLDIEALHADWYVANAHKWLFAPKGSAIFYAAPHVAPLTRPGVTSHFVEMGFPRAFDYIGTRDYSAWLTMPAALAFFRQLEPAKLRSHIAGLVTSGSELLTSIGARPVCPREMCGAMRSFQLPQRRAPTDGDAADLVRALWDEERIQVKADVLFGALLLRFSAQAYVEKADLAQLTETLDRRGWPGR